MSVTRAPRFSRHPVHGLHTVAHLFPRAKRCGVYILEFTNGERYVGQAVDVVRRFGQHRRSQSDIAYLEFCAARRDELADLELALINQQRTAGYALRNIAHALGPLGTSDVDPLILPSEQDAWLAGADVVDEDSERADDKTQRKQHRANYQRLRKHWAFPFAAQILNLYVPACIPKAACTERTFWSVSAMPGTNRTSIGGRLCTVSINKMETLYLIAAEHQGERYVGGVVNLSHRLLQESAGDMGELQRTHPHLEFRRPAYESGGGDVVGIAFAGLDGYFSVGDIPGVPEAARALNLMLMRKGPTLQWRWHCYDLADWAFADEGAIDAMWNSIAVRPAV